LIARRCIVSGRVQGVFYRASTRQRAESLGVTGHALNLPDGRVEVLACGETPAVTALCEWLWQGPPASKVTGVEVQELDTGSISPWPKTFRTA
jgi:acylphosphatase